MAIGTTAAVDPTTGERTESQFNYTPVDPNDELMRQAFDRQQQAFYPPPPQPRGPTPYWENPETYYPQQTPQINPIEQAKAATAAAYKYIALRGYQQDLKSGASAADAFAKWGPMLVQDTSFAPALKALQPAPTGRWVPPNPAAGQPGFYEGQGPTGVRAYFPPEGSMLRPDVNAEANVRNIGNRKVYVNPRTGALTFLDDKPNEWDKMDYATAAAMAKEAVTALSNPNLLADERAAAEKRLKDATDRQNAIRNAGKQTAPASETPAPAVPTPAPAAPIQAAAPQKREGFPFAPMEKSKRVNGQIYSVPVSKSTPNGIAVWTTAGWIPQ